MKRVLIIGNCGAGKTTLSRAVAARTGLPLIHLDQYFWGPNWTPMERGAWDQTVRALIAKDRWIIEGNYHNSLHLRVPRADTIIYLDYPRWLCFYRAVKRYFQHRNDPRPEIAGNKEKLDFTFLKWILTFPRQEILLSLSELATAGQEIHILNSPREAQKYLKALH